MKNSKVFVTATLAAVMAIGIFIYALNNSKYIIQFDTDGGEKIESQSVKKGEVVKQPETPKKEGYVFVEWQLDGKKYDFNKKVKKSITLKAKWATEIYVTVSFNTDGGSEVTPIQALSGTTIKESDITNPTKEGYTFAGWYIGEKKYDFTKKVTSNLTLTAKWLEGENVLVSEEETKTEVKEETKEESVKEDTKKDTSKAEKKETSQNTSNELKVGDKVVITGSYATSYDGDSIDYDKAIGWEREIIAIYEDEEYPYQVGDSTGTTGFFKADSIKLED